MPPTARESHRIVIAGASSLLGAELKTLLEESKFAGWDLRLLDEEDAAGTLTEAGGEPVVIQPVDEGSFEHARFVFFAGSPEFLERNSAAALAAPAGGIKRVPPRLLKGPGYFQRGAAPLRKLRSVLSAMNADPVSL